MTPKSLCSKSPSGYITGRPVVYPDNRDLFSFEVGVASSVAARIGSEECVKKCCNLDKLLKAEGVSITRVYHVKFIPRL